MLSKVDSKGTTSYTYDEVNRLLTVTEPGGKVTTYTYTAAGNRSTETIVDGTNTTVKTYTYDDLNQLIQTVNPDGTSIINTYNGEGIRVQKQSGSTITKYLYEGDKVILELDGAGNQKARNIYGINQISRII